MKDQLFYRYASIHDHFDKFDFSLPVEPASYPLNSQHGGGCCADHVHSPEVKQ